MNLFSYALFLYLCGSIPFGILFGHLFKTGDIRKIGSGNIGATNMLRTGHKGAAFLTLLCDFLKGLLPILVVNHFLCINSPHLIFMQPLGALMFYLIPVLAHVYPIWLKFKGGKGVATALGVLFAYSWHLGLIFIGIWLLIALVLRISSLSALIAFAIIPFINWYLVNLQSSLWLFPLALLIFYTHCDNIRKIIKGQEAKIGAHPIKQQRSL
jgi:acyl phosphate:glycerol-3-phosphate acyltransferase